MEPPARIAACAQVRDLFDATAYIESPDSQQKYAEAEISPYFWPNGKMPIRDDWKRMAETGFETFRLKVGGLVATPVELSLADLEKLGETEHITMHHCIQGWSGIAKWGGIPMKSLIELVRPKPEARVVAFFSFGEALYGGPYYDTQRMENLLKPQCLLASQMNGRRLPQIFGAPLRLRVENQLETRAALGSCGGPRRENEPYGTLTRCGVLPESGPGV